MRTVLVVLITFIISVMDISSQQKTADRQPVAAGRFYSADKETLTKDLNDLFGECKKTDANKKIRAIITPHAGYVFSGKTAAAAYAAIPASTKFSNIFIIGSSHIMSFDGASVYNTGDFITPLGRIPVNREIANKIAGENRVFNFPVSAHIQEHSIEVQLPFIQYRLNHDARIIPIVIGTQKESTIKLIAEALRPYFTSDNLFVISSDFSHYPPYDDAIEADRQTAMGIVTGKPAFFLSSLEKNAQKRIKGLATSMCGWTSGLTLLYLAEGNNDLEFNLIDYSNSGDSPYGGKEEVVGYYAISLTEKTSGEEFTFTDEEKEQLFTIARNSIKAKFGEPVKSIQPGDLSPRLSEKLGAFVTLKIDGALRGCIGRFVSSDPLYEVVQASAVSSAFGDPRFSPLSEEEFKKTEFEITVLGPLKHINSIDELTLGKHGIYIKKGNMSGTMLPQVAIENHWTKEQFLGYTSRDKAGLGWDGWKNAELFIYEGLVLEDKKK